MADYTIEPYRYAANVVVVQTPSSDGYKTRAARLATYLGGRWVHRAHGYLMNPAKAARFEKMYAEGYDASAVACVLIDPAPKE